MNLLTAIVPTLREIRTPLLCGYVYLLTLWLALGQHVPERGSLDSGSVGDLFAQAMEAIGRPGQAAALTVVAYLIGSLVSDVLERFLPPFPGRVPTTEDEVEETALPSERDLNELRRLVAEVQLRGELGMAITILSLVVVFRSGILWMLFVGGAASLLSAHSLLLDGRLQRLRRRFD